MSDHRDPFTYTEKDQEIERLRAENADLSKFRTSWQESSMKAQYERGQALKRAEQAEARLATAHALASVLLGFVPDDKFLEYEAQFKRAFATLAAAQPEEKR